MKRTYIVLSVILALSVLSAVLCSTVFALDTDSFVLEGASVEVDGTNDKEVKVIFYGTSSETYISLEGEFSATATNQTSIILKDLNYADVLSDGYEEQDKLGKFYYIDNLGDGIGIAAETPILTATYLIPANTAPGDYTVTFNLQSAMNMDEEVRDIIYTATITVTSPAASDPAYTAALQSDFASTKVGDTISVDVLVGGSELGFASSQLSLAYQGLSFVSGSAAVKDGYVSFEYDNENGTLDIIDYGES